MREEERKRRGGPSAIEKAAAMPWKIEPALYRRLEKGDEVLFYTFTSAQRYAEARASVEALFPGRAIALEHTPEIEGGRDVGEWVMTVKPKGAKVDEGALIAGRVGWKGVPADPSEKPSLQTNPFKQTVGGQTRYISAADAIKDAVNNYNAYSTKFSVSTSDISTRPDWFMSLVMGRNIGDLRIKDPLRQALLAKGVNINVEIAGTSYRMEGGREVVSGYTYVVTISGENVRKPLEVARNEACSKPAGLPEPQLKRIAAFEGQEPKKEPTYAERMAALKKKVPPGS